MARSDVVRDKHRRLDSGDAAGSARAAALLAAEAQTRAAQALDRWSTRIDTETGLLPKGFSDKDQVWDYADAGADLYPHLLIAAAFLRPAVYPSLAAVLTSERASVRLGQLPSSVDLATNLALPGDDAEDRIYGAVEYAKDGLLPLSERLGHGPWFERMGELVGIVNRSGAVRTRFGTIPSDEGEVNGQMLQVLARLYWATGDEAYLQAARPIAQAYLDLALPGSGWVPARTWDFVRERKNSDQAQLRDHGNEIVAGLVEFHLIETARREPAAAEHRIRLRAMLDRLLEIGRTPDGLWKSTIDVDTGRALKDTLSDNWGYLYAAYLTQAAVEETWPDGDLAAARRYRSAAETGLRAASRLELYAWQGAEQDGYADTIESALYLLNRLASPEAARWVDRQAGTLFGAQDVDGRVEDRYLDGNFIRTALLYAAWQSQGVRVDPWRPDVLVGAVPEGDCLRVLAAAADGWHGRLIFDAPRHRLHLRLPLNYPRLNEWPEWFVVQPDSLYRLDFVNGSGTQTHNGSLLNAGLDLQLEPRAEQQMTICPAG